MRHARVSVRQQWTKACDEGRKLVALKTGQKAWRTIDIDSDTVAVLARQRHTVLADRRQWGADYQDLGLVFSREDGTAQDPDQVTSRFEKLAEECPGMPRIKRGSELARERLASLPSWTRRRHNDLAIATVMAPACAAGHAGQYRRRHRAVAGLEHRLTA